MPTYSSLLRSLLLTACLIGSGYGQPKAPAGPAPGKLIDIGGHKLHLYCSGASSAVTVIFEAGGGGSSKDWTAVQKLVSTQTRACSYDRAGSGWSETGPAPRTMRQEVFELHELLKSAGVTGPYILAGQSIGGLLVRIYAEQYDSDVAGMVLVDPTHESSVLFNTRAGRWMSIREQATGRPIPEPRHTGEPAAGYKPEDDYLAEEFQLLYLHRKEHPQPLGNRPLFVLAAGRRPPPPGMTEESYRDLRQTKEEQVKDQAGLAQNSKFVRDPESGHEIQADNPSLVARAIEEVVRAATLHTRLQAENKK